LLTNAAVVDDAMRFAGESKDKLKLIKQKDNQESNEADYDEKDSDRRGKEELEQGTGESSQAQAINQVFLLPMPNKLLHCIARCIAV
jgi:hypothetical protein